MWSSASSSASLRKSQAEHDLSQSSTDNSFKGISELSSDEEAQEIDDEDTLTPVPDDDIQIFDEAAWSQATDEPLIRRRAKTDSKCMNILAAKEKLMKPACYHCSCVYHPNSYEEWCSSRVLYHHHHPSHSLSFSGQVNPRRNCNHCGMTSSLINIQQPNCSFWDCQSHTPSPTCSSSQKSLDLHRFRKAL